MKRKSEKQLGICISKVCQHPVYNNGKHCSYHLLASQESKLRTSHPSVATTVANVLGRMRSVDDHGLRDRLFENTKEEIRLAKAATRPSKHNNAAAAATKESNSVKQTYTETTTESVSFRQRVCNAESTITRERRPDGTVIEHEVVRSSTNEQEVEFKRQVQKSVGLFLKRVATEQHQWTQQVSDPQYWEKLTQSVQDQCVDRVGSEALCLHKELPLDQCLQLHESRLQSVTAAICAAKPAEITLQTKIEWIRFAYEHLRSAYPQNAFAIKRCLHIFCGAKKVKAMDAAAMEAYTKAPPQVYYPVPSFHKDPSVLSRTRLHYLETTAAPPLPRTTFTDTQLLDIANAYEVYCAHTPRHTPLGDQLQIMAEFVDEIMSGEYSRLLSYIASWQISWRVVHGLEIGGLAKARVESETGMRNEYLEMQDRDALINPFYHPDLSVRVSWVRMSVVCQQQQLDVILPDYVALRLFGAEVDRWHKDVFCPAIAKHIAQEPSYQEQSFVCLDGEQYPRSVLENAPEFETVLQQLAKQHILGPPVPEPEPVSAFRSRIDYVQ